MNKLPYTPFLATERLHQLARETGVLKREYPELTGIWQEDKKIILQHEINKA